MTGVLTQKGDQDTDTCAQRKGHVRTQCDHLQPRGEASEETNTADSLTLDFPAASTLRK